MTREEVRCAALDVRCQRCGADPDSPCVYGAWVGPAWWSHDARTLAAQTILTTSAPRATVAAGLDAARREGASAVETTAYGGSPAPNEMWPNPIVTPIDPAPAARPPTLDLLSALAKKRVRVAVRVDELGLVHVRVEGPAGLAAEISGSGPITLETEI